jgi:hypothetical protein
MAAMPALFKIKKLALKSFESVSRIQTFESE